MKIEPARECEIERMLDIRASAVLHDAGSALSDVDVKKWAAKHDPHALRCRIQGGEVWVARRNDERIAGWAWRESWKVKQIYVASEYQRQGIGKCLLEFLERRMQAEGVRQACANAALNAVAFYQHCGYAAVPEERHETTQTMRKELQ